ncbi:hypothetical protein TWF281_008694 [Arthrobotrys megalospora]
MSFVHETRYIQQFGRYPSNQLATSSSSTSANHGSYPANASPFIPQAGPVGGGDTQESLHQDDLEGDKDQEHEEWAQNTTKPRDRVYTPPDPNWLLGCPLQKIGYPELPCAGPGAGRRFGGTNRLSYIRSHIKKNHSDTFSQDALKSIAHPQTTTWTGIFRKLFPDGKWPRLLQIPSPWIYEGAPTLYDTVKDIPHRKAALHGVLEPLIQRRNPNTGTGSIETVAQDVSNPVPESASGPDIGFHDSQPQPDQQGAGPQYQAVNSHQDPYQIQQQEDLNIYTFYGGELDQGASAAYFPPSFNTDPMLAGPNQTYNFPNSSSPPHGNTSRLTTLLGGPQVPEFISHVRAQGLSPYEVQLLMWHFLQQLSPNA